MGTPKDDREGGLVGRRVRKSFLGLGCFEGSIVSFNPSKGFYKVQYEDGDREDMDLDEVQQFLIACKEGGYKASFSNGSPLDDNAAAAAAACPASPTSNNHGAVALASPSPVEPCVDVYIEIPASKNISMLIPEASDRAENDSYLQCDMSLPRVSQHSGRAVHVVPLAKQDCAKLVRCTQRGKRKRNDEYYAVETSVESNPFTEVKKIRIDFENTRGYLTSNAMSDKGSTHMADDKNNNTEYAKNSTLYTKNSTDDMNGVTQCVENIEEYAENITEYVNNSIEGYQNLSHGHRDAESVIKPKDGSLDSDCLSAESSFSVEFTFQHLDPDMPMLPPPETLPPSSGDFLVPHDSVLDCLAAYSFLRSFSRVLFLSPFSLESFQQCLCLETPTSLMDSVHLCLLKALQRHLERLAKAGSERARDCLRQPDWMLLDIVTWPSHLMGFLATYGFKKMWNIKFPFPSVEYYKVAVESKVAVLNFLCDHVMDTEEIRAELATRELLCAHKDNNEQEPDDMLQMLEGVRLQQNRYTIERAVKREVVEAGREEVEDTNIDECMLCGMNGNLICCDGCPAAYHARCVGISRSTLPQGDWFCPECMHNRPGGKQINVVGLKGGDLLGVDPYGHNFIAAWGYLLVVESYTGSKLNYYSLKDLPIVLDWLERMKPVCDPIRSTIMQHWSLVERTMSESHGLDISLPQISSNLFHTYGQLHRGEQAVKSLAGTPISEDVVADKGMLALPVVVTRPMLEECNLEKNGISTGCGLADSSRIKKELDLCDPLNEDLCSHSLGGVGVKADKYTLDNVSCSLGDPQCYSYTNYYSLGDTAATAAASLAIQSVKRKARTTPMNEQLEAFCKATVRFSWPSLNKKIMESAKERCGWCFCCSNPVKKKGCILNQAAGVLAAGAARVPGGIRPTKFGTGHLPAVAGYLLHIEDNLKGLLLGPWEDASYRMWWRNQVKQAKRINDLKFPLLQLESCLRPVILSGKWFSGQEDAPSMTLRSSTGGNVAPQIRAYKKFQHKMSFRRNRLNDVEVLYWLQSWKRGKSSKKVFQWNTLPSQIARQAGRQGGLKKIQGLIYLEVLDTPKRNRHCAWQARVEAACTVSEIALQVRCLDAYIRWDDLCSNNMSIDTSQSQAAHKTAIVYAKEWKDGVPMYLVDSETNEYRHKLLKSVLSSDPEKVWVTETQMPLSLLRDFEERLRVKRQDNRHSLVVSKRWFIKSLKGHRKGSFEKLWLRLGLARRQEVPSSIKICKAKVLISCKGQSQICQDKLSQSSAIRKECHVDQKEVSAQKTPYFEHFDEDRIERGVPGETSGFCESGKGNDSKIENNLVDKKTDASSRLLKENRRQYCPVAGIRWRKNRAGLEGLRPDKILLPGQVNLDSVARPKCFLCSKYYDGSLLYVCCEYCPLWFHGDALKVSSNNFAEVVGFKCHKCRKKGRPDCPYSKKQLNLSTHQQTNILDCNGGPDMRTRRLGIKNIGQSEGFSEASEPKSYFMYKDQPLSPSSVVSHSADSKHGFLACNILNTSSLPKDAVTQHSSCELYQPWEGGDLGRQETYYQSPDMMRPLQTPLPVECLNGSCNDASSARKLTFR